MIESLGSESSMNVIFLKAKQDDMVKGKEFKIFLFKFSALNQISCFKFMCFYFKNMRFQNSGCSYCEWMFTVKRFLILIFTVVLMSLLSLLVYHGSSQETFFHIQSGIYFFN